MTSSRAVSLSQVPNTVFDEFKLSIAESLGSVVEHDASSLLPTIERTRNKKHGDLCVAVARLMPRMGRGPAKKRRRLSDSLKVGTDDVREDSDRNYVQKGPKEFAKVAASKVIGPRSSFSQRRTIR